MVLVLTDSIPFCPRPMRPHTNPSSCPGENNGGPFPTAPGEREGAWGLQPGEGGAPRAHLLLSGPQEAYIADLDAKSGASLKLTLLNPKGRIWTMVAGGGASVVYR